MGFGLETSPKVGHSLEISPKVGHRLGISPSSPGALHKLDLMLKITSKVGHSLETVTSNPNSPSPNNDMGESIDHLETIV